MPHYCAFTKNLVSLHYCVNLVTFILLQRNNQTLLKVLAHTDILVDKF